MHEAENQPADSSIPESGCQRVMRSEWILYWVIFSKTSEDGEWGSVHM